MSSKHYGIEQARKTLGDLALEVQRTGEPIILTRGNSRTPIAQITPVEDTTMHVCPVCGFQSRKPLVEGPLGTCYRCPARTRHIAATDGPLPGHALCEAIPVYDGQGRDDAPDCPVCVHAQETGVDPLRHRDMALLGFVITTRPELWKHAPHNALLGETERGRRLVRDGYLTDDGETLEPTPAGRALCEAYEEAWRGDRQANANHSIAIAIALRAVDATTARRVTADHIRDLYDTQAARPASAIDLTDLRYMVLADVDGEVSTVVADTAKDQGWEVLYSGEDLDAWLDGTELTDSDAETIAAEVNEKLRNR